MHGKSVLDVHVTEATRHMNREYCHHQFKADKIAHFQLKYLRERHIELKQRIFANLWRLQTEGKSQAEIKLALRRRIADQARPVHAAESRGPIVPTWRQDVSVDVDGPIHGADRATANATRQPPPARRRLRERVQAASAQASVHKEGIISRRRGS